MMRCSTSALALVLAAGSAVAQITGPSTTTSPYLLPAGPNAAQVQTVSILTVGDTIGGYRMVGIPDGLGAMGNGNGTFDLFMNHELGATSGITRAHGSTGAFVSRWNISSNLTVNSGRDHNTAASDVNIWNGSGYTAGTTQFNRFCSADLAAPSAYRFGNLGTDARIFMNGEEAGLEGRAFAHVVSGAGTNSTWQLPSLGRFSWENSVANPKAQAKTIVMGTNDTTPGQVYMYVGNKTSAGTDIERAGLTNGSLYGIQVAGTPNELRNAPPGANTSFSLFNHGNVSNTTGAALNTQANANSVTNFLRPEDGAWDTRPGFENNFYFVTTDRFDTQPAQVGHSRLWRMSFTDISNPEAGGNITCLMDGTQGQQMFDNLTVDSFGRILIQEDVGNQAHLGKIWLYDIASGNYGVVAQHDSSRFLSGNPGFLTQDEEASGIIDAKDILGPGWFLLDSQAHYGITGELVEGGQLLAMYVDPSVVPAPASSVLIGLGGLIAARRRRS